MNLKQNWFDEDPSTIRRKEELMDAAGRVSEAGNLNPESSYFATQQMSRQSYSETWRWLQLPGEEFPSWHLSNTPQHYNRDVSCETGRRFKQWRVTRNWKRRLGKGEIIIQPFMRESWCNTTVGSMSLNVACPTYVSEDGLWKHNIDETHLLSGYGNTMYNYPVLSTNPDEYMRDYPTLATVPTVSDTDPLVVSEATLALQQCWARTQQQINTIVTAVEAKKTLRMINNKVSQLRNLLVNLGSVAKTIAGLKRRGLTIANTLVSEWLEFRYGIRPLIYELNSYYQTLLQLESGKRYRVFKAFRRVPVNNTQESDLFGLSDLPACLTAWRTKYNYLLSTEAGIFLSLKDSAGNDLSTLLRAFNVLDAVWELVPYSFVVDWFVNVGTFIQAYSARLYLTPERTYITSRYSGDVTMYPTGRPASSPRWAELGYPNGTYSYVPEQDSMPVRFVTQSMKRWKDPEVIGTPLVANVNLNATKVTDLLALAYQLRTKLGKL